MKKQSTLPSDKSIASLSKKTDDLIELVNHLNGEIKDLKRELKSSQRENAQMKEKLAKYEHPKNSNNSSVGCGESNSYLFYADLPSVIDFRF